MNLDEENACERGIFAEYLAKSTTAPIFMIRRGAFKYIGSADDPALLFNVENDPAELKNLAQDAEHATILKLFQVEAATSIHRPAIALSRPRRVISVYRI